MYYQRDVVLTEIKKEKAMLAVKPQLHQREEKNETSQYIGTVALRIFEYGTEYEEDTHDLSYHLAKKDAKYLFYRLLHGACEEGFSFYGGEKGKNPLAKMLWFTVIKGYTGRKVEIKIIEGEGEVTPSGAIPFKEGTNRESASIILSVDEIKQLALEVLDYIRNEELIAQLHGNPLHDQLTYKLTPLSENNEEEQLIDFMDFFKEEEKEGAGSCQFEEKDFAEMLEMVGEQEQQTTKNVLNPQPLLAELHAVLQTYLLQGGNIPLSKKELKDVLRQIKALQSTADALKIINQKR